MDDPNVMEELKYAAKKAKLREIIDRCTKPLEIKNREAWGIFINGERVAIASGKAVWAKRNHAMAALTNQIKGPFERYLYSELQLKDYRHIYDDIIKIMNEEGTLEVRRIDVPSA